VGIGGIGVSAVARLLHHQGVAVQGSDIRASQLTEALEALGIPVYIGHNPKHLQGADLLVYSTAVPYDNPERVAAREAGIPEAHRSELLGLCMEGPESVGVAGTHGKGTVSAMITHMLISAERDPSYVIGGLLNNYGLNAQHGKGPHLIAEVDESDGSHLNLRPEHLLINNLEVDHLNYYSGLEEIVETMRRFIGENPKLKSLYLNGDDPACASLAEGLSLPCLLFGEDLNHHFSAQEIEDQGARICFQLYRRGELLGPIELRIPGAYNALNATGAAALAINTLGLSFEEVQGALASYTGLENRFTLMKAGGYTLVKDYISHPTGMRKVLESARKLPHHRIFCVFKPYRFTLMRYHGEEYAEAFRGADELVITTMYAAEERPIDGIDTPWFVKLLREAGNVVHHVPENSQVLEFLSPRLEPGDMVIFFGGDDFFRMADAWAQNLERV